MNARVNNPVSDAELERRWRMVRDAMREQGIDALLMQANNDFMGGYVKYFTDIPATNGYPVTVVFPREDRMTMIGQGSFGMEQNMPVEGDGVRRGVATYLGTPSYAAVGFTTRYDSELAARALASHASGTIGIVGKGTISATLLDDLRSSLPAAKWVDASDLVDRIKVRKSAEEVAFMRRTAALQDASWQAVLEAVRPGMRDIEVAGIADMAGRRLGSEQGLFLCASGQMGKPAPFGNRHLQNRVIEQGDYFTLLMESNGPGGYYTELGRTCVLGRASARMQEEHEMVLEARRFTLGKLVPGVDGESLWNDYNRFMRERGRPEERRLHCHGQGYDMVERPLMRYDETMRLSADTVLACHPTYVTSDTYSWICDDYLIGEHGVVERLHKTAERIFELG